jgi:hypothetical protein
MIMTRFDPKKNQKSPEEWSALALNTTRENNLQWNVIGGIVLGALAASATSPLTGGLVLAYFLWDSWKKASGIQRNQTAIVESGCVAQVLEGDDFINYASQAGHDAVMAELKFAGDRNLPMSNAAYDYIENNAQQSTLQALQPSRAFNGQMPQQVNTQLVTFTEEIPDLPAMLAQSMKISFIVGVPGSGKGMFVTNALQCVKDSNTRAKIFYVDPKADPKEAPYFNGRVDRLYSLNCLSSDPQNIYEWLKKCFEDYENDGFNGKRLLVVDEFKLLLSRLELAKGGVDWLTGKLTAYSSSGESRGMVLWAISQSAHTKGGFDGSDRAMFIPVFFVDKRNISASEALLAAKMIPSDKRLRSDEITQLCLKSSVGRAVYFGGTNKWYPMPELPNYSGYDRDTETFLPGYKAPLHDERQRLEKTFTDSLEAEEEPLDNLALEKIVEIVHSAIATPVKFEAIRNSRKWDGNKPGTKQLRKALLLLIEAKKLHGNEENGYEINS